MNLSAGGVLEPAVNSLAGLHIAFSDLVSGPATGLGDGLGDGTIVTLWCWGIGDIKGLSSVMFTDAQSVKRNAAHHYYWKKADGELPSGPANLYESHGLYEIAFSIPAGSATGLGSITIGVGAQESNSISFTVRAGNIYWVAPSSASPSGNNNNAGTYAAPKEYLNATIGSFSTRSLLQNAYSGVTAGDICYSIGVDEPTSYSGGRSVGLVARDCTGTSGNPVSIVAYPGTRPTVGLSVDTQAGFLPINSPHFNISKFAFTLGHIDPSILPAGTGNPGNPQLSNTALTCSGGNRFTGNKCGQRAGKMITGWSGAINAGGTGINDTFCLGNEILDQGTANTSRFQHTVYFSVRSNITNTGDFDFSFNYLHDNFAMFGFHLYDEDLGSVTPLMGITGTITISNNLIADQVGAGINYAIGPTIGNMYTADLIVENNLLIRTGTGETELEDSVYPPAEAIRIGGIEPANATIRNNTLIEWSSPANVIANGVNGGLSVSHATGVCVWTIENNLLYSKIDDKYVNLGTNVSTIDNDNNNAFYTSATNPTLDTKPSWTGNVTVDPQITVVGDNYTIDAGSPLINAGFVRTGNPLRDIQGKARSGIDIGAIEK